MPEVAHLQFLCLLNGTASLLTNQIGATLGYDSIGSKSESHYLLPSTISLIVLLAYQLSGGRKEGDMCL
jgi:hypothetical protein